MGEGFFLASLKNVLTFYARSTGKLNTNKFQPKNVNIKEKSCFRLEIQHKWKNFIAHLANEDFCLFEITFNFMHIFFLKLP